MSGSHLSQAGLELLLLPLSVGIRRSHPHTCFVLLEMEPRASCILSKHYSNWATIPSPEFSGFERMNRTTLYRHATFFWSVLCQCGSLACFCITLIVNAAAVSMGVQAFLWHPDFGSSELILRKRIAEHSACLCPSFPSSLPSLLPSPSQFRFELASLCLYSWLTMGGAVLFCLESLSSLLASRHPCSWCALILLYHRLVVCLAELRPYYFWPITLTVKKALLLALTQALAFKWLCKLSSQEWKNCKDGLSVLFTRSKL